MRRVLLAVILTIAVSGCFGIGPHRITVSADALEASPLEWSRSDHDEEGEALGLKIMETLYVHRGDDDTKPPYPGSLQVFSLRGGNSQDRDWLLDRARTVVGQAAVDMQIDIDASLDQDGARSLRDGVSTKWFMHEGTIAKGGGGTFLSPETDIEVRILAEVGVDGRSKTGLIAIAFAKVEGTQRGPVAGVGDQQVRDMRTWLELVADPEGSIDGASFSGQDRGLVYNLVTNG